MRSVVLWSVVGLVACGSAGRADVSDEPAVSEGCEGTTGTSEGDCAPEVVLQGVDGTVRLSEAADQTVVMAAAAMWCPSCRSFAQELDAWAGTDAPDGVVVWSIVLEQTNGDLPTAEDAATWADTLELDHLVSLTDTTGEWAEAWTNGGNRHTYLIVDGEGQVVFRADRSADASVEALEAALP